MKFFPGQRVRIKTDITVGDPRCNLLLGEIVHVVECVPKDVAPDTIHVWYYLDVRFGEHRVFAHEHALIPVYDGWQKIDWTDCGNVWSPFATPAVIRSNRSNQSPHGRTICATTDDRKVANGESQKPQKEASN